MKRKKNVTKAELLNILSRDKNAPRECIVYGVPRGGWCIAELLSINNCTPSMYPEKADVIVDDIIDSGRTRQKWLDRYPEKKFYAPFGMDKVPDKWIVFPWESGKENDAEELITRIIEHVGDDPKREGLIDTPKRVVRSWKQLYGGYGKDPAEVLKLFSSDSDQIVICKDIEFYSTCEHHMIPFYGKVHIGYIPDGYVVGLSKLARLTEIFARRLQIQENMTQEISTALNLHITNCQGTIVIVEAKHLCMCGRGVEKQNSYMITSAISGKFKESGVRSEFLHLIRK